MLQSETSTNQYTNSSSLGIILFGNFFSESFVGGGVPHANPSEHQRIYIYIYYIIHTCLQGSADNNDQTAHENPSPKIDNSTPSPIPSHLFAAV